MSVPRPYGFLYNDQGELIVDFSAVKRSPLAKLLSGDRIPGKDLAVQGLEGVSFRFQPGRVDIISFRNTPTVRVNSQPLIGEAVVEERAWIGTQGQAVQLPGFPAARSSRTRPDHGLGQGEPSDRPHDSGLRRSHGTADTTRAGRRLPALVDGYGRYDIARV